MFSSHKRAIERDTETDSTDELTVLMAPDYTDSDNPYQRNLCAELEGTDANVVMSDGKGLIPLTSAIRSHGIPDVVHLHWLHRLMIVNSRTLTFLLGIRLLFELLVTKLLGVRVVWTVHNLFEHQQRWPRIEMLFKHAVVRLADTVIVHCSTARETVIDTYHLPAISKQKFTVIPHGHYIDSYPDNYTQGQARRTLDIDRSAFVFLFFGSIRPYKNIPALINAFQRIEKPNARLLIAGNPEENAIEEGIRRRCASDDRIYPVLEFIPPNEIQIYMNTADVVVLPFRDILTSGSALLAMSFRNALVTPQMGCMAEVLDQHGGFLYDPETDDGLFEAMNAAMAVDTVAMGRYNYRKAKQYDWGTIAQRTYETYTIGSDTR